ncbi:MAG: hypothetical protein JWO62_3107 [Acidimicrobiaceae bacterium]|nr:hypothetical protein [Acidimicrobiaceae bacterium]
MARRMEVELTSSRDDGTWTWRAVGAREPRGVVEEKVLPSGSHVGDVLRVEADFELDGITITSVLPAKAKSERGHLIEIAARPVSGTVTTSLVGRGAHTGRSGGDRPRQEGPSRSGPGGRDGARRDGSRRDATRRDGTRRDPARPERRPGAEREGTSSRPEVGAESTQRPSGRPAERRAPASTATGARPARPRPQRLVPGTEHRDALLASLPAEQRPIAEQLTAGGLPAVRRALEDERVTARAEGRASAPGDAILTLAEQLLPGVREALWLDRAEAAVAKLETISLRDLRAAVLGGAPRDDHGREVLQRLREALDERVTKLRTAWEGDVAHALDEGRVLQALRLSARPPEPTARFPAALVVRLAEAAGSAMTAATPPERWLALLEATAASPIRRSVKPEGLPEDSSGALRQSAQMAAGRVPALAPLLGLTMPPPPRPLPPPPPRAAAPRRPPAPVHGDAPAKSETTEEQAPAEVSTSAPEAAEDRAPAQVSDSAPAADPANGSDEAPAPAEA